MDAVWNKTLLLFKIVEKVINENDTSSLTSLRGKFTFSVSLWECKIKAHAI